MYSRYTFVRAAFAERFDRTTRYLLTKPVFDKVDGNWVDVLPTKAKKRYTRVYSST